MKEFCCNIRQRSLFRLSLPIIINLEAGTINKRKPVFGDIREYPASETKQVFEDTGEYPVAKS